MFSSKSSIFNRALFLPAALTIQFVLKIRCSMLKIRCSMFLLFLLLLPATINAIDGPLSPEDSLKYLKTEPGLKVELVAAEPMVIDPVAVAWDEKGRMYVVEDRGYPVGPGKGKP